MAATIDRASNPREWFDTIDKRFDPHAARGLNTVFQFQLSGEEGGNWHIEVKDGCCKAVEGIHGLPTVTMKLSAENYVKLAQGDVNGMMLYLKGRMKIEGNRGSSIKLPKLFPKDKIKNTGSRSLQSLA